MAVAFIGRQAKLTTDRLAGWQARYWGGVGRIQIFTGACKAEGLLESALKSFHSSGGPHTLNEKSVVLKNQKLN